MYDCSSQVIRPTRWPNAYWTRRLKFWSLRMACGEARSYYCWKISATRRWIKPRNKATSSKVASSSRICGDSVVPRVRWTEWMVPPTVAVLRRCPMFLGTTIETLGGTTRWRTRKRAVIRSGWLPRIRSSSFIRGTNSSYAFAYELRQFSDNRKMESLFSRNVFKK